jgi:hypothetical protein
VARRIVNMDHSSVMVYQYEYFDRQRGCWQRGERYATPVRIAKLGGVLLGGSGIVVHASRVGADGYVNLSALACS